MLVGRAFTKFTNTAETKLETFEYQLLSDLQVDRYKKNLDLDADNFQDPIVYWKEENIDLYESKMYVSAVDCEFTEGWVDMAY